MQQLSYQIPNIANLQDSEQAQRIALRRPTTIRALSRAKIIQMRRGRIIAFDESFASVLTEGLVKMIDERRISPEEFEFPRERLRVVKECVPSWVFDRLNFKQLMTLALLLRLAIIQK